MLCWKRQADLIPFILKDVTFIFKMLGDGWKSLTFVIYNLDAKQRMSYVEIFEKYFWYDSMVVYLPLKHCDLSNCYHIASLDSGNCDFGS